MGGVSELTARTRDGASSRARVGGDDPQGHGSDPATVELPESSRSRSGRSRVLRRVLTAIAVVVVVARPVGDPR
jgi:hypothetical protein